MVIRPTLLGWLAAGWFGATAVGADETTYSLWDKSVVLRGGVGYKDNLLLGQFQPEGSGFWLTSGDFFLFRLSDSPVEFSFYLSGEDRRYFSSDHVQNENLVLAQAKGAYRFSDEWKAGLDLQYYYLRQVFDASVIDTELTSVLVRSHTVVASPFVRHELPHGMSVELQMDFERNFFDAPLDDYNEFGPELLFAKQYGNKSEASVSYSFRERAYDSRAHRTLDFQDVPDTSLRFQQHEIEGGIEHSWDKARRWRTRLRAGYEVNRDNGTGFYDYSRYRLSPRVMFVSDPWKISLEGKWLFYDYRNQRSFDSDALRERTEYLVNLRIERSLTKTIKAFVESEHEWSISNSDFDEYQVNTVFSGVDWEF